MNMSKAAFLASAASLVSCFAIAGETKTPVDPKTAETTPFEQIDRNSDGAITELEAQDTWLADAFAAVDVDRNGYISKSEYDKARG